MELHYKFCQFAPKEYRDEELYAKPDTEETKMLKREKAMRKDMRTKSGVKKQSLVEACETTAPGGYNGGSICARAAESCGTPWRPA